MELHFCLRLYTMSEDNLRIKDIYTEARIPRCPLFGDSTEILIKSLMIIADCVKINYLLILPLSKVNCFHDHKKLILPTFRLDALILLKLDCRDSTFNRLPKLRTSGKLIGSSQCTCMPGLAPRATLWACRWRALLKLVPPFSFLNVAIQQSDSSYPLSLLLSSHIIVIVLNLCTKLQSVHPFIVLFVVCIVRQVMRYTHGALL